MKTRRSNPFLRSLITAFLSILTISSVNAVSYYWDSNGTTTGADATPTGTWGNNSFWNTNSGGITNTLANTTITVNDDVFFAAGTDAVNGQSVCYAHLEILAIESNPEMDCRYLHFFNLRKTIN